MTGFVEFLYILFFPPPQRLSIYPSTGEPGCQMFRRQLVGKMQAVNIKFNLSFDNLLFTYLGQTMLAICSLVLLSKETSSKISFTIPAIFLEATGGTEFPICLLTSDLFP